MINGNKRNTIKKLLEWSTYSIALLPIMPNGISSISMISWAALVLIYRVFYGKEKDSFREVNWKMFFLYSGNFLLLLISLLYTADINQGINDLIIMLPLLLFPFCFFLFSFPISHPEFVKRTLDIFFFATLAMSIWVLIQYGLKGLYDELGKASSFNTIFRETAEQITDKHPTYLSLYLSLSLGISVCRIIRSEDKRQKVLSIISIPVFCFLLVVLAARTPVVATFLAIVILLLRQIKKQPVRMLILALFVVAFLGMIRFTPALFSRIQESQQTTLRVPEGSSFNSTNIRVGIYSCTWQLIKENLWLGYGVGSDRKMLNQCYARFPTDAYRLTYYNTHNQYADFWLLTGIFSLLIFIASIIYALYLAVRFKNDLFLYFVIITSLALITENLLARQAGVVFYSFFMSLFVLLIRRKERSLDR